MRIRILQLKKTAFAALFVMLLIVVGVTKGFAQTFTVGNLNYSVNEDGVSVTVTGHVDGQNATGELVIPESVEYEGNSFVVSLIGENAFSGCAGITSLTIGNSITEIRNRAFYNCDGLVGSPVIGNSVDALYWAVFAECDNITSITIPASVSWIAPIAFYGCDNLNSVYFNATNSGPFNEGGLDGMFGNWIANCPSLTNIIIGEGVVNIPAYFASNCTSLTGSLTIPNSVVTIGEKAFYNCSGFTGSLTIPNSVTNIESNAFYGCTGFSENLTLGQSLASIGNSAFYNACENLSTFTVLTETPPSLGTLVFTSVDYGIPVQVPCGVLEAYQNASGWSQFTNIQEPNPCLWDITATANPAEGGTVSGAGTYEQGATCTLTATPAEGYEFLNWKENDAIVSTETSYSFSVTDNRNLVANFGLEGLCSIVFNLYDSYGDGWTGNKLVVNCTDGTSQELTIDNGSSATYTLNIMDGSHVTLSWIEGQYIGECSFNVQFASNGYLIYEGTNLNGTQYEFDLNCDDAFTPFTITAVANPLEGGSINGVGGYILGEICTLIATPNEGRNFICWRENGQTVSTEATYSFTVTGARNLVANFSSLASEIIVFADPNVKTICINNWDSNGDGELSYVEAAAVTNLGNVFEGNTSITAFNEIQYFTSLTTICDDAFNGCTNLASIIQSLPPSISSIGDRAFLGCSSFTGDLTIPASINTIGNNAFYGCSSFTGELTIHESVVYIGGAAFAFCGFTTLNYNAVNCEIGWGNVWNDQGPSWCCFSPFSCGEQLTTLNIGNQVQRIPDGAFQKKYLESMDFVSNSFIGQLSIPESVTRIENYAFENCEGFTGSLQIPNSVNFIGEAAFFGCTGLEGDLTIGTSVDTIYVAAFSNTSFTSLNYNAVNCQIYDNALSNCPLLTKLYIGDEVESLSNRSFMDCTNLTGILVLPNSLKSIGDQAFYNCYGLEGVVMSNAIESIGAEAFRNCGGLRGELTLPETLQSVGNYAFASCDELTNINYNAINCTTMGNAQSPVFYDCASMAHIGIGENVESIPNYAFKRCSTITDMTVAATVPPTVGSSTFGTLQRSIPVTVQCGTTAAYQAAQYWNEFTNYNEGFNYMLEVTCNPERGTVVVNKMADCDDPTVRVTAYPEMGYAFLGWSENGTLVSEANPYTFTMESSRELQAEFIQGVSYSVTVTVVPATAGTVTGQGNYNDGSAVTLNATSNSGYAFVNWTENGSVVSTDEEYTFTIHANRNLVANFTPYAYHWDVNIHQYPGNMTAIGVIQIDGVEQATPTLEIGTFCNDECRGRQLLTYYPQVDRYMVFLMLYGEDGDEMSFKLYDHVLEQELTLSCTSLVTFAANTALGNPVNPYVFNFINSQQTPLAEGWTWYSTYIEQDDIEGLQMMTEALNESGVMIKSQTGFIANSSGQWMGNLNEITNESMYMVNTTAATLLDMVGNSTIASQHPITMDPGWNWIGYPMTTANGVSVALSDIEAQPNDVLKSQESFATYYEGFGWFGSLNTITPGMGLMYDSKNSSSVTFTYTEGRSEELKRNVTAESNHWVPDMHKFTNNMNVMAVVELDDVELRDGHYELAVFAGNECRGSVRLVYVEPIDRYVAFLTVAGREATDLQFVLFDADENREYGDANESLVFESDAVVGNTKSMMTVHFTSRDQESDWSKIAVYPNPADGGEHFSIVLPAASDHKVQVEIINELGAVVAAAQSSSLPLEMKAPATPGLYTLKIVAEGNAVCFRKLVVK